MQITIYLTRWLLLPLAVLSICGCQNQASATRPGAALMPSGSIATASQSALASSSTAVASSDQAIALLRTTIEQDNLYQGRFTLDCLSFSVEAGTSTAFDLAIRGQQGGSCGGDFQVAPIVDRFRVLTDGTILWYDVVNDQYLPYAQAREQIRQQ